MSARVRWKSARFIPLSMVESILAGKRLNDNQWSVDGASGCLVPAGKPGPFRTSVRWNAAVDRLSGTSERHATACIEFREGCGLWTVVGFRDDAARDQWQEPVKAAFRWLADSGFGGERSRGWGRSETPEFVEGTLPGLIIEYKRREPSSPVEEPPNEELSISALRPTEEPELTLEAPIGAATVRERSDAPETDAPKQDAENAAPEVVVAAEVAETAAEVQSASEVEPAPEAAPESEPISDTPATAEVRGPDLTEPMRLTVESETVPAAPVAVALPEAAPTVPASTVPLQAHWLLSLFTPAADDTVDWGRGSYTVLARGGRIESPSGSGELKKQIQMVAEGSVLYADGVPLGAAADVAPDGFAHPVFRAGFALAIPLPEVH
jgi:CRISPR/Cas system CSM-associated protein Csm4 (group 5 of RAMP superfamily)